MRHRERDTPATSGPCPAVLALVGLLVALSALACRAEPAREPEWVAVSADVVPPTLAQLDAAAGHLPRCALPAVSTAAWPRHALGTGAVTLRLPPRYAPEAAEVPPGETTRSWASPDSGSATVMPDGALGGMFVLQPAAPALGGPTQCALPMLGHLARVTRAAYGAPGGRDTLHVVTLDAPVSARLQLGGGAMHPRRASLDTLLAALAALEVGPSVPHRP